MKSKLRNFAGTLVLAIAGFFGVALFAAPAHATCTPYTDGQGIYPTGTPTYFAICLSGTVDPNRRDSIVTPVKQLPHIVLPSDPPGVRDSLQKGNVSYYYFDDRDAANLQLAAFGVVGNPTARCGETKFIPATGSSLSSIVVAVFDKCTIGGVKVPNPNLRRTTIHETGHALAISIAKNAGNSLNSPDKSPGWIAVVKDGTNKLTPVHWTDGVWNQQNKNNYLCNSVFLTIAPSALELDLGSTVHSVCSGNPVAPIDGNGQKTPLQITHDKTPYFTASDGSGNPINNSNQELWAELFTIAYDSTAPGQTNFLQLTDQILGFGNGWADATGNFHCAKVVMEYFFVGLKPPTPAQLTAQGCASNPGNFGSY